MLIVKTNVDKARAKLRNLSRGVHRTLPEVLESEGRNVAISLAKSTQPFGTGADAKDLGERAVSRDIGRVYATVGDVFASLPLQGERNARAFWKLISDGEYDAARALVSDKGSKFAGIPIGKFDDGALHRGARNSKTGRVSQHRQSLVVTDARKLMTYAQGKINLVGFAKSAWAGLARQLGSVRGLRAPKLPGGESDITANWITRKTAPGSITRNYDGKPVTLTLRSTVRYADNVLSDSARRNAERIARGRLFKQLEIAAKYEARKNDGGLS